MRPVCDSRATCNVSHTHSQDLTMNVFHRQTQRQYAICLIVNLLCIFCALTAISAIATPIGVKFCLMVHIGPDRKSPRLGAVLPRDSRNPKFWAHIFAI